MTLLAETEGIWAETAGGVTLAVARKLIEQGKIDRDGSTVLCITGNGLKTQEALGDRLAQPVVIEPTLEAFEALVESGEPEPCRRDGGPGGRRRLIGLDARASCSIGSGPNRPDGDCAHGSSFEFPPPCARMRGGQDRVEAAGATVGEVLANLGTDIPALRDRLFDGDELQTVRQRLREQRRHSLPRRPGHARRRERRGEHHPGRRRRLSRAHRSAELAMPAATPSFPAEPGKPWSH